MKLTISRPREEEQAEDERLDIRIGIYLAPSLNRRGLFRQELLLPIVQKAFDHRWYSVEGVEMSSCACRRVSV